LPHSRNLPRLVKWTPSGDGYAVAVENSILLYNTLTGELIKKLEMPSQVLTFDFFADGKQLAVGTNTSEAIAIVDVESSEIRHVIENCHENRVKLVQVLQPVGTPDSSLIVSTSSDGVIKVWNLEQDGDTYISTCIGKVKTDARMTCMVSRLTNEKGTKG